MDWQTSNPAILLPGPFVAGPPPDEKTSLRAGEHRAIRQGQDLVDQFASEAARRREAFPFAIAPPSREAATGEPQPDRILPVSQHRVDRTLHALGLPNGSEVRSVVDDEALHCRDEQTAVSVHLQLAASRRLGKTWIRGIEAQMARP